MSKYRIVTDKYLGYEVQVRHWWWPFWRMPSCNTHHTVEEAEDYARRVHSQEKGYRFVKMVDV